MSADAPTEGELTIDGENAVLRARQTARDAAEEIGFSITDVTRIITATSELARNIHKYADYGVMHWRVINDGRRQGLELVFEDDGPGIDRPDAALQGEFSTSGGMGQGLSGARELVDDLDLETSDEGTTVTIRKWA